MDCNATRDTYRLAIVEQALDRRTELAALIVSTILEELPEYASGRSAGELEDIRAGVQQSVDFCLATMQRGVGVGEDERHVLRRTGAQRARQGIPKPALLASVKVAVRTGRQFLTTLADVGDDPRAFMAAFREVNALLDRFEDEACSALAEGHDEGWPQVLSAPDRGEAVLVDRLLERRFADEEEMLAHAAQVGLSRHRRARVAVVASAQDADEGLLRATAAEVRSPGVAAVGPLRIVPAMHLPLVLQPRDGDDWRVIEARLSRAGSRHGTTVVWSVHAEALTGLSSIYRSVCEDLPFVAAATAWPGAVAAVIPRFHRVMAVGTAEERAELLGEVLRPLFSLPERERGELLDLLDALYETGGSTAALGRLLYVHKNTVGNRVRRVQDVTGLDVRRPAERLVLETAMRMRKVLDLDVDAQRPEWQRQNAC